MRLEAISEERYEEYRLRVMFDCYKWDPQFLDNNTIAKYALVLSEEEHEELIKLTESIDKETRAAEEFLNKNLEYTKSLGLNKKLSNEIKRMSNYKPDINIRLMRYDFHPTVEGKWAVSEVNSDVPGGFAEATLMPKEAIWGIGDSEEKYYYKSFGEILTTAITGKVIKGGKIMLVHCTCYSDDRQVMQFLGDALEKKGYEVLYGAVDHINFKDKKAYSILDGNEGELSGIIRFTPLEWMVEVKPKRWEGYFDTEVPSCNHPVAIFAQTKRFPFVWDVLETNGIDMSNWRKLLPHTIEVKDLKKVANPEEYIYKPVYGRVGENIAIKEAVSEREYKTILSDVKKHPSKYIAQRKFVSKPLKGIGDEEYHVCLGSYTVDGVHAGYYARISKGNRIDSNAADIPVLIERKSN